MGFMPPSSYRFSDWCALESFNHAANNPTSTRPDLNIATLRPSWPSEP